MNNNTMRLNALGKFEALDPTATGTIWWADTMNNLYDNLSPQMALEHKNILLAQYPDEFLQGNNEAFSYFVSLLALGVSIADAVGPAQAFAGARAQQLVVMTRVQRAGLDAHGLFNTRVTQAHTVDSVDRVDRISG